MMITILIVSSITAVVALALGVYIGHSDNVVNYEEGRIAGINIGKMWARQSLQNALERASGKNFCHDLHLSDYEKGLLYDLFRQGLMDARLASPYTELVDSLRDNKNLYGDFLELSATVKYDIREVQSMNQTFVRGIQGTGTVFSMLTHLKREIGQLHHLQRALDARLNEGQHKLTIHNDAN